MQNQLLRHLLYCWSWASTNPAPVIGLMGVVVSYAIYVAGRHRARWDATFKAIEMLQSKELRSARFRMPEMLKKAGETHDFNVLKAEERAEISGVASTFGIVGSLARNNRLVLKIVLETFASSIIVNHERLQPYAKWRSSFRSAATGSLWRDFDWLRARAQSYLIWHARFKALTLLVSGNFKEIKRYDPIADLTAEAKRDYRPSESSEILGK